MINRININEKRLDNLLKCIEKVNKVLDEFESNRENYQLLNQYYGSKEWFNDKESYEKNRIKKTKAGVLSEDAVWNMDEEIGDVILKMKELISLFSIGKEGELMENNIGIITDKDVGGSIISFNNPKKRTAARGIVIRNDDKIALFNKQMKKEYKLPGGGIEDGENPITAFKREILEETGCNVEVVKCLGIIKEENSQENYQQLSYIYVSKVINDTGKLSLTPKEIDEGGQILWVTKEEALDLIGNCFKTIKPSKYENLYHSKFIVLRDKKIIEYYINNEEKIYE